MEIRTKQKVAILLSITGSIGTIATAILTRRAAKKELEVKKEIKKKPGEEISKKELLKVVAPIYIPATIIGIATIASTISSTILSRRTEASLTAMALLADQGWRKYKGQVKHKLGLDNHADILKNLGKKEYKKVKDLEKNDGKELYYEEHIGFFRANPEKFALAFSDINQRLQLEDYGISSHYTTLYDLIKGSEADILDKDLNIQNLCWGWSAEYLREVCEYVWVHMTMFDTETPDGSKKFKTIVWGEDPFLDPGNSGEIFVGRTEKDKESNQFKSAIPVKKDVVIDYELE